MAGQRTAPDLEGRHPHARSDKVQAADRLHRLQTCSATAGDWGLFRAELRGDSSRTTPSQAGTSSSMGNWRLSAEVLWWGPQSRPTLAAQDLMEQGSGIRKSAGV